MSNGTLVDSTVLLDIFTEDPRWLQWSSEHLARAADAGPPFINPVVFAEISVRFSRIEDLDSVLPASDIARAPVPWEAAFLAGKAFRSYRRRRGATSTLPDFFIGAHAAVVGARLLTRDSRRFRTYFPTVELIAPSR
jgi:predicted nucleic acid-binding protein